MLKQETEKRSLPIWHTPPQSSHTLETQTAASSLNRAEAEQVLLIAAHLQSGTQDRLSIAEIEALAAERGIAPRYIRQALTMNRQQLTPLLTITPVRLTRHQWRVSSVAVLCYWIFVMVLPVYVPAAAVVMGFLPILLVASLGAYLRYKRAGAAAAVAVMTATVLGMAFMMIASRGAESLLDFYSTGMLMALLLYVIVGVASAALRQWITDRQPPSLPTVIKPARSDR